MEWSEWLALGMVAGAAITLCFQAALRAVAAVGSEVFYEQACASEAEAEAFAARMRDKGFRADVEHNQYDYSWSVAVRVAESARKEP